MFSLLQLLLTGRMTRLMTHDWTQDQDIHMMSLSRTLSERDSDTGARQRFLMYFKVLEKN